MLFDDIVLDKHDAKQIEMAQRQYSNNEHGIVEGIGLVNSKQLPFQTMLMDSWYATQRLIANIGNGR